MNRQSSEVFDCTVTLGGADSHEKVIYEENTGENSKPSDSRYWNNWAAKCYSSNSA